MSKRDDLVPSGRHTAEKWTRIGDYVGGAQAQLLLAGPQPDPPEAPKKKIGRRGLWLPIYALGIAAAGLWISGSLERGTPAAAAASVESAPPGARSSSGVMFGLCDDGGGTNCVVDGDSFYFEGKSVRIAGIDAPETHAARCDAESLLGRAAAERLQSLLNSGEMLMIPVEPGHDPNGRLLRQVTVDGQNVGAAMTAAGLARNSDGRASWC